jgi:glycine/D-amino acid oxidase-like deaminating enzyme
VSEYLTHAAAQYFGRENWGKDGEVLMEWTGIMAYTKDKMPIVGEAPGQKGLYVCAGFNGHGELENLVLVVKRLAYIGRNGTYL